MVHRVANLQLRGVEGRLRAGVSWPAPADAPPPLAVLVPGTREDCDALRRDLVSGAGLVVLVAPATLRHATTALEWAADHATELDADPSRLLVAGQGTGGSVAAALALRARDQEWPPLVRQVLVHPVLGAAPADLAGVAPATVVTSDEGARYAALLRRAGVTVEDLAELAELASSLRRTLATPEEEMA